MLRGVVFKMHVGADSADLGMDSAVWETPFYSANMMGSKESSVGGGFFSRNRGCWFLAGSNEHTCLAFVFVLLFLLIGSPVKGLAQDTGGVKGLIHGAHDSTHLDLRLGPEAKAEKDRISDQRIGPDQSKIRGERKARDLLRSAEQVSAKKAMTREQDMELRARREQEEQRIHHKKKKFDLR